jgi:hypothetical protein
VLWANPSSEVIQDAIAKSASGMITYCDLLSGTAELSLSTFTPGQSGGYPGPPSPFLPLRMGRNCIGTSERSSASSISMHTKPPPRSTPACPAPVWHPCKCPRTARWSGSPTHWAMLRSWMHIVDSLLGRFKTPRGRSCCFPVRQIDSPKSVRIPDQSTAGDWRGPSAGFPNGQQAGSSALRGRIDH